MSKTPLDEEERKKRAQQVSREAIAGKATTSAQTGILHPASEQKQKTMPLIVRMDKQNDRSATAIAARMPHEEERDAFLGSYRAQVTDRKSPNYQQNASTLAKLRDKTDARVKGGVYADTKEKYNQEQEKRLGSIRMGMQSLSGLRDANGNAINVNTADFSTVVQSVRSVADKGKRDKLAQALETLTKTEGSRFYGQTLDKALAGTYLASPEFSQSDYDGIVQEFDGAFYPQDGHDEENAEAYLSLYEKIDSYQFPDYATRQLREALDKAYVSSTGKAAPDAQVMLAEEAQVEQEQAAQTEKKKGLWQTVIDRMSGKGSGAFEYSEPVTDVRPEPGPAPALGMSGAAKLASTTASDVQTPLPTPTPRPASDEEEKQEEALPVPRPLEPPAEAQLSGNTEQVQEGKAAPEVQGPVRRNEEPAPAGSVDLADDPARAIVQYARSGRGDELSAETQRSVQALYESSPGVRALLGVIDDGQMSGYFAQMQDDPFAVGRYNEAMRAYYLGDMSFMIGGTLSEYAQRIYDTDFPEALRADAAGVLISVMLAAEDAQQEGALDHDPARETLYDAYLRQNGQALAALEDAFSFVEEEKEKRREAERLSAEQAKKDAQEQKNQAMQRIQTGMYTPEDVALLEDEMAKTPRAKLEADSRYSALCGEIRADRVESDATADGWYNVLAVDFLQNAGLNGDLKTADAMLFKDMLEGYQTDALRQDAEIAYALGYGSLEDYYKRIGVTDARQRLQTRAVTLAQQFGATLSEELVQEAERAAAYAGTGEASTLSAIGAGAEYGVVSTIADDLESIWTLGSIAQEDRPSEMTRLRREYVQRYGYALAAFMYSKDMREAAENGSLVSDELGTYVTNYLDSGEDPFRMAIDPNSESVIQKGAAALDRKAEGIAQWARENLTAGQGKAFEVTANTSGNLFMQAVATSVQFATGSAGLSTFVGYGLPSMARENRSQLADGKSRGYALNMGLMHAATDTLANMGTSGKLSDKLLNAAGLPSAVRAGAATGTAQTTRTFAGMMKALVKGAAEEYADEFADEFKEGALWQAGGGALSSLMDAAQNGTLTPSAAVKAILRDGLGRVNPVKTAAEFAEELPEWAISMVPLALMGGVGDALGDGFPATRRATKKLAQTGTAEAAVQFMQAASEELQNPENTRAFDRAVQTVQTAERTAAVLLTDEEAGGTLAAAQAAQEQAKGHQTRAENSAAAMRESVRAMNAGQEKLDAGQADDTDVQMMVDAAEAFAKNKNNFEEATREAAQKREETNQLYGDAVQAARAKAAAQLREETAQAREAITQNRELAKGRMDAEIAALDRQIEEAQARFESAQGADVDTLDALAQKMGELMMRREALESGEADIEVETDAETAEDAQVEPVDAERERAYYDKEKSRMEREAVRPALRRLRTTRVLVDDTQAAEILNQTGLQSLTAVNRAYRTRFTRNRKKGDVSLDGSFYAELAQEAGGYLPADSLHPEEDVVKLLSRQASVGEADMDAYLPDGAHYGTLDPIMQQLSSQLKKRTGLDLVTAPLADNVRALYDRENGRILLSSRIGAGEQMRTAVFHELTHYIESAPGYEAYKNAVLDAAYAGDDDAMALDMQDILDEYEIAGVALDEEGAQRELVAAATEKVIRDENGLLTEQLLSEGKRGFLARLYTKLTQFLARRRAKKAGKSALALYDDIENARARLREAIASAEKWQSGQGDADPTIGLDAAQRARGNIRTDSEQTGMQYALRPNAHDDRSHLDQTQTRQFKHWFGKSQVVDEDGKPRIMYRGDAQDIDIFERRKARSSGLYGRGFYFTQSRDHAAEYGSARPYYLRVTNPLSATSGKKDITPAQMRAFLEAVAENEDYGLDHYGYGATVESVMESLEGANDFAAIQDVNATAIGDFVAAVELFNRVNGTEYDGIVTPTETVVFDSTQIKSADQNVGTFDPQNPNVKYALGLRQFGNETAQRMDAIDQSVKDMLRGTRYETDSNREQLRRAHEVIDREGMNAAMARLLAKKNWTADDNVQALCIMAQATQDGDSTTAALMAGRYNEQGTRQGQALQSRKLSLRLTPEGAMGEAIRAAREYNKRKGLPEDAVPVGNAAPVQGGKGPKALTEMYSKADALYADLSALPQDVSWDNPWNLPLNPAQMRLIDQYHLTRTRLRGYDYSNATLKERMLSAIVATPSNVRGDGLLTLCQQLTAMQQGLAVVTEADLNYIASQMSEAVAQEDGNDTDAPRTQAGKVALARVQDAKANIAQATAGEKLSSIRFMNMLSSPVTWTKNILSNVLTRPMEQVSTGVASVVDRAAARRTGTRTTALPTRAERKAANAAFAHEVAQTFEDYVVTHADTSHGRRYDTGNGRTFQNEALETAKNVVDFAMQIGDRPFYEQCYAEELAVIRRLGMKVKDGEGMRKLTDEEMHQEATQRAIERVFQEDNAIVSALNSLRQHEGMNFAMSLIIPFTKTPTNVAARMFQYSPAGLAKAIVMDGIIAGKMNNGAKFDQRKFVMGIGRGLTGTGMLAAGVLLAAGGYIKRGREDEEDQKRAGVRKALGEPYGLYIELFGQKHELDWAMPAAAPLIAGAHVVWNLIDAQDEANLGALVSGVMIEPLNEVFNSSMLSALSDLFRGYGDTTGIITRFLETSASSFVGQLTPSAIRAIAKATDPYVRDTASDSTVMRILNENFVQNWPGLRQLLPVKTDITGDKTLQSGSYSWGKETQNAALHMLDSFLTPTATIGEKNDPALLELLDLSYRTGETGFLPASLVGSNGKLTLTQKDAKSLRLSDGKSGVTLTLSAEETRRANALYADVLFNGTRGVRYPKASAGSYKQITGLRELMESRSWARMSDEERVEAVEEVKRAAKELVSVQAAMEQAE